MQEEMAKKLNLGKSSDEHDEGSAELSQSRDDEGEGVVGQNAKAFDPFDSDEGDEI